MTKKEFNPQKIINWTVFGIFGVGTGTFSYFSFVGNKVDLLYQKNEFNNSIIQQVPTLKNAVYRTTSWLPIRCAEIIYGNTLDKRAFIKYNREIIETPDGENIAIDWSKVHEKYVDEKFEDLPIVLILPGLSGGSHSNYSKLAMLELRKNGFLPVVFNPRGTGIKQKSLNLFDYRKNYLDIDAVVDHINKKHPKSNLYLMGYSLGASLGVKYLYNNEDKIKGMVCIANPIDVYKAAESLNSFRNRIYR